MTVTKVSATGPPSCRCSATVRSGRSSTTDCSRSTRPSMRSTIWPAVPPTAASSSPCDASAAAQSVVRLLRLDSRHCETPLTRTARAPEPLALTVTGARIRGHRRAHPRRVPAHTIEFGPPRRPPQDRKIGSRRFDPAPDRSSGRRLQPCDLRLRLFRLARRGGATDRQRTRRSRPRVVGRCPDGFEVRPQVCHDPVITPHRPPGLVGLFHRQGATCQRTCGRRSSSTTRMFT